MFQGLQYEINLRDGSFSRVMQQAQGATGRLDSMVSNIKGTLAAAFGGYQLAEFGKQSVMTSAKVQGLNNAITFASKSEKDGAKNLKFLSDLTSSHGSNLMAASEGYKTFLGAMLSSNFAMDQKNKMFGQVDTALTVMNASADDSKGVFLALGQIMSKGKVQAEELRGQIGERIPGAFSIAARAMGVSEVQLNKMMDKGELYAQDFLPKFAAELEKTFGSGLAKASKSFQSQMNLNENAMLKVETALGEKLQPAYLSLMQIQVKLAETGLGLLNFYEQNKTIINTLGVAITAGTLAYIGYTTVMKIATIAQGAFNLVVMANPLTLFIATVGLAVGGLYLLTKNSDEAAESQTKLTDQVRANKVEFNGEIGVLKSVNLANTERKGLIDSINQKYGAMLPKLLTEKSTIQEITNAQNAANKAFEEKIFLQLREETLGPKIKRMSDIQADIYKKEITIEKEREAALSGKKNKYGAMLNINAAEQGINKQKSAMAKIQKELASDEKSFNTVLKDHGISNLFNKPVNSSKEISVNSSANTSVSSNKSVRNVIVNMPYLIKEQHIHVGSTKEIASTGNMKREITKELVAIIRDSEQALAS